MDKIRVAIIGTGFGAKVHAPLMSRHPGFHVTSIASVNRGRLNEITNETGIKSVYDDWKEMLVREKPDLVSVTSAPTLHHDMVSEAFKLGCHVLCEKPMAFDATEAQNMIHMRDEAMRLGVINFEWRFLPARQKVKELLDQGQIGKIQHINYSGASPGYRNLTSSKRGWLGSKAEGGGMLGAIGSHMVDALLWWTKDQIATVQGQLMTHVPTFVADSGETENRDADDGFHFFGSFHSGTTFTSSFVTAAHHSSGWRLEVIGTEGTILMTNDQKVEVGMGSAPMKEVPLSSSPAVPEDFGTPIKRYYAAFYPMLDHLHDATVRFNQKSDLASFEDGYRVQLVLDAVRKSSEEGRRLDI
ncbi:Gfo/Idh/MocA family protein [Bacillus fonticola]|uniref:Gfo/Idh/MocA family protein n=1 Tax=Bacillus fonticola TaxID=2728853 RepID=UPI001474D11F|nr:Gfo/Idh/MocA family oxidoreductase [Bacillus fonticola]